MGAAFGEWCLFPFCCQPSPAAFLTNLQPGESQQASWHKNLSKYKTRTSLLAWTCILQDAFPCCKILQGQWRQVKDWRCQDKTEWFFFLQGDFLTAKQSWLHVFFNFPVVSEAYVSCLSYLTLVSRTWIVLWQTVVFLHLLNIALFHQRHAFCYRQQPYHGGNESPVLVTCQWWAKLYGLCNLLLSQCCRCDLWMPLISMAFMKLTEWDEISFCCARSLLWDKRANSPGEFICQSHLWLEWNKKLMPLREGEGRQRDLLSDVFAWFLWLYLHAPMKSGSLEKFSVMLLMLEVTLQNK